jgi:DNA-binding transcriptional regulator YhcF (GntR family)
MKGGASMSWNLDSDRPIFAQIVEHLQYDIISGVYQPGQKLPSVRDLAAMASVNPNTMQRALSELERDGYMHSERTAGRFITEDTNMIQELKTQLATAQIQEFLESMKKMGLTKEEILNLVEMSLNV